MSTTAHYKFSAPAHGGNAQFKMVCYFGSQSFTRYSFDGRMNQAGTAPKAFDKPQHWNADNGFQYLLNMFEKEFRNNPTLTYAFIADSNYPASGQIKQVWSVTEREWTTQVLDNALRYRQVQLTRQMPTCYTFRLSIPLFKVDELQKWVNFYTSEKLVSQALLKLIGEFQAWQTLNPGRAQLKGQIFGSNKTLYDISEREIPRYAWFDVPSLLPKYHQTQRVIKEYNSLIQAHQNFEELISNL